MIALQPTRIDFDRLRTDVHQGLADLGQLEFGSFPMTERVVVRGDDVCGIYFCLHGPRNVKLTAICDLKRRTVIYYGTDGVRAHESPMTNDQASYSASVGRHTAASTERTAA